MKHKSWLPLLVLLTSMASAGTRIGENSYCGKAGAWLGAKTDFAAALPTQCVNTGITNTPSPGATIIVSPGDDIDARIAEARCGDTLLLTPGQYKPFTLVPKGCDAKHWISIRTAARGLPGAGQRITPCYAGVRSLPGRPYYPCPKPRNLMATISTKPGTDIDSVAGASYYRIGPGIELSRPDIKGVSYTLVTLAGADHIIFDRVWAHGTELPYETKVGFDFTGATNIAVINSYLNNFKCIAGKGGSCTDAHGIGGGDDPDNIPEGTWKVYNNFIEASGENIIFGGATKGAATPSDIEVRLNHFYKVPAWNRNDPDYVSPYEGFNGYIVKNIFELKNARRVLLEGNRLEYSWGGYTQKGFAILLTPRGAWASVEDVTIRYNYVSHVGSGIQLKASRSCTPSDDDPTQCKNGSGEVKDSRAAARWSIHDLLVDDVDAKYYLGGGSMAAVGSEYRDNPPLTDVVLDHITHVTNGVDGDIMLFGTYPWNPQPQMGPFRFTNSVVRAGEYNGIWSLGGFSVCVENAEPIPTFDQCFAKAYVAGNLVVGWGYEKKAGNWPDGNQLPLDYSSVFVNPLLSAGDYHVLPEYAKTGTDGRDPGADIDTIMVYMQKAVR